MDDNALPVSNIPGWMQIGVSFAVFMFATMGAIWGYVNRQAQQNKNLGATGNDEVTASLKRIEVLFEKSLDANEKTLESQVHSASVVERLIFIMEMRQKNEDIDRIVSDAIQRALPKRSDKP